MPPLMKSIARWWRFRGELHREDTKNNARFTKNFLCRLRVFPGSGVGVPLDKNREGGFVASDRAIECVALERLAARLADEPHQLTALQRLRGGRPRIVVNLLF